MLLSDMILKFIQRIAYLETLWLHPQPPAQWPTKLPINNNNNIYYSEIMGCTVINELQCPLSKICQDACLSRMNPEQ